MIVHHHAGQYTIGFGPLADAALALENAYVLTDDHVWERWGTAFRGLPHLVLRPGEQTKDLVHLGEALGWLARQGADRKSTLVALGGGVIGDLGGFVAATYMRGISYVQVPTTLLAQVDSSIGGKVAVDLPEGKNLAGAFWPPVHVHIADEALDTLPERQIRNGMAEVLKYGFILEAPLLEAVQGRPRPEWVRRCLEIKRDVVERDEFETLGLRAVLNFGHTVGHALERLTGYGPLLHGEAIAIGMAAEARMGERLGLTEAGTSAEVVSRLAAHGLPTEHPLLAEPGRIAEAMRTDKKASRKGLAFALLLRVGESKLFEGFSPSEAAQAIAP